MRYSGFCKDCSKQLSSVYKQRCRSCSKKGVNNPMYGILGTDHPNYNGGHRNKRGYMTIWDNNKKKNVLEHRVIVERTINRQLRSSEIVHHINHDKTDNSLENLIIMNQSDHVKLHKPALGHICTVPRDKNTGRFMRAKK